MARAVNAGFTLLEVLVALVLLTVFAVTSYRALDAVLVAERHARAEMAGWQALAKVYAGIEADLQDAVAASIPPAPDRLGFLAERTDTGAAAFSLDRQLPDDQADGLERVSYRYADGHLTRSAVSLLHPRADAPTALLDGLQGAEFSFLDGFGAWRPDWGTGEAGQLPRAIAIVLAWPDGRRLRRVFRVS